VGRRKKKPLYVRMMEQAAKAENDLQQEKVSRTLLLIWIVY
jgi:hypothetical protein